MSLGDLLRDALRDAIRKGGANIAVNVNVDRPGARTSVYADDDVTIIDRDGEREVIHHSKRDTRD
jgi:hypothetical protein